MNGTTLRQLPHLCWGLRRTDNSKPWNPEHDVHYDTAEDARTGLDGLADEFPFPAVQVAIALIQAEPCWVVTCPSCGEEYGDDEWATLHLPDRLTAERTRAEFDCDSCDEPLKGDAE